jgi:transcriptional regulator with XRE-family HTH domain
MKEQGYTKLELAERAGISVSFVSDITTGKGNPSLKIMKLLAAALAVPLPLLFLHNPGDMWSFWEAKGRKDDGFNAREIGDGEEEITVMLPSQKAFIVKKWAQEFQKTKIKKSR